MQNQTIHKVIRKVRENNKLSQEQLAKRLKVTANYISLLENGRKKPSLDFLSLFSQQFKMPLFMVFNEALTIPKTAQEKRVSKQLSELMSLYEDFLHANIKKTASKN